MADGRLRIVYNHFPFINDLSESAAEASECAGVVGGRNGFWNMVDSIYEQGKGIDRSGALALADDLGLDVATWDRCMDSDGARLAWETDAARGEGKGVNSTPTIFLAYIDTDGEQTELEFQGVQDYERFSAVLDAILDRIQ